jgi:HEPN domain-containing protein
VAYHAQQCAEKYLKAYLVLRGIDFPFTHNIAHLLELCPPDATWGASLEEADTLTRYAIVARYPGPGTDVSADHARLAAEVAARVREVVRQALAGQGMSL